MFLLGRYFADSHGFAGIYYMQESAMTLIGTRLVCGLLLFLVTTDASAHRSCMKSRLLHTHTLRFHPHGPVVHMRVMVLH